MKGIIIKGIGGFYYVEAADRIYECKAKGIFRKKGITPYVGDNVEISGNNSDNTIDEIYPRKNFLKRPPLANIDQLIIVASLMEPLPNTLVMDKIIAVAEYKDMEPIIVINKTDLSESNELYDIYSNAGFTVIKASTQTGEGIDQIKDVLKDKISAFTGNSGVGKSSILNAMLPELNLNTGEISAKLGRGRHTTRHVELFKAFNGLIADTPGFSTIEIDREDMIVKDELEYCFREFDSYISECQFIGCSHINTKGCRVIAALEDGKISAERYGSYVEMYNEVKDIKPWHIGKQ